MTPNFEVYFAETLRQFSVRLAPFLPSQATGVLSSFMEEMDKHIIDMRNEEKERILDATNDVAKLIKNLGGVGAVKIHHPYSFFSVRDEERRRLHHEREQILNDFLSFYVTPGHFDQHERKTTSIAKLVTYAGQHQGSDNAIDTNEHYVRPWDSDRQVEDCKLFLYVSEEDCYTGRRHVQIVLENKEAWFVDAVRHRFYAIDVPIEDLVNNLRRFFERTLDAAYPKIPAHEDEAPRQYVVRNPKDNSAKFLLTWEGGAIFKANTYGGGYANNDYINEKTRRQIHPSLYPEYHQYYPLSEPVPEDTSE